MAEQIKSEGEGAERWLFGEARLVRQTLVRSVGWALAAGLLVVLQARLLALACQRVVIDGNGLSAVLPLAGWVALLALLRGAFTWLGERSSARAAANLKQRLRSLLHRRLLSLGPAARGGETGPLTEAVTSGIDALEPYVARFLPHAALAALLPPLCLLFVAPAEWRAGLVLLLSAPFIPLFMVLIGRGSEALNRRQWSRLSRMAGHLLDLVQGLPDLKICSAAKREAATVARVSEEYRHSTMAVLRLAFLSALALEFFTTVGTAVVAVMVGFRLLSGGLSLLDGLFVLLLAPEFYLPLRVLGLSYHARMQGVAAAERIAPLLAPLPAGPAGAGRLPVPEGGVTIVFDAVTFRHAGGRGGVHDVSLELPAGTVTALVGESGAGKSTLAGLLLGLTRPQEGSVTVNGRELSSLDQAAWRRRIAWVPQHPFFCHGTVRANLVMGLEDPGDGEIQAALEAAGARIFVDRLPAGLDTLLGDRGAGLSGGELRRLALARVFLRNASLVVLDEPTAGLDRENEELVSRSLRSLARGRTLLVISHREQTVDLADRVALLAGGRLVQLFTPGEGDVAGGAPWVT